MRATDVKVPDAAPDRDVRLENFAAELTRAAYPLVLRRRPKGSWLEVELALWRALAETVERWCREPPAAPSDEHDAWREGLLIDLTVSATYVALTGGIEAPLLEVQRALSTAFQQVIGRFSDVG